MAPHDSFADAPEFDPSDSFTTNGPNVKKAAADFRDAAAADAKNLKEDAVEKVATLRSAAEEQAHKLKEAATERATAIRTSATDTAVTARDYAEEQWQDTRLRAREVHATCEDYIRANPTKSILTAVGIGYIIGLLSRK